MDANRLRLEARTGVGLQSSMRVYPCVSATADGVRLKIQVQPRARRTEVVGEYAGALKIHVAAPPAEGAANAALVRFLAERLGVSRSAVVITSGASSRAKLVRVSGIGAEEAARRLGLLNFRQPGP
jgi:uncharacterized protein (TIGR00251 family)